MLRTRLLTALALAATAGAASATPVLLENARIFDGERDIGLANVLIDEGRIVHVGSSDALPAQLRRIDYRGKYIMPGLVSDHAHVGNTSGTEHGDRFYTRDNVVRDLRQFQAYGVTTVTALGMNGPAFQTIRSEVNADPTLGAQLRGAGAGIGVPDGAPPAGTMGLAHDPVARPSDAAGARAAVRAQADAGVDLIKLWVDNLGGKVPMMQPAVYRAAIDEAHRRGLKVAAHIHDLAQAKDLVASGLDIIGHGVRDTAVDEALIQAMQKARTWYVPTVNIDEANYIYAENPAWLQQPFLRDALPEAVLRQWSDAGWRERQLAKPEIDKARAAVAINLANLRTLHEAGIAIGFGTDAGAMPQRVIGFAEHRELRLMTQAGFTPAQALRVATRNAATLLGLEDRGRIAPGLRADLLVLDADPTTDIGNTRRIHAVWQAGQHVAGPVDQHN